MSSLALIGVAGKASGLIACDSGFFSSVFETSSTFLSSTSGVGVDLVSSKVNSYDFLDS